MKFKMLHSVKTKLTISIFLLTLVLVSFVALYFPERFEQEQFKAIKDKAYTIAKIISSNIATSVYFEDKDVLKEDLDRLYKYNEIKYIVVSSSNVILYSYNFDEAESADYKNKDQSADFDDLEYFKVIEEIKLDDQELGYIYLGFDLANINEQLWEMRKTLVLINLVLLLLGSLISLAIGYYFTKPLGKLVATAEKVSSGNLTARVSIPNKDEMGYLADRFNNMVAILADFYNSLENKVQQRTNELAETNKKLELEIEERKCAEEKIKASLDEKTVLLKEIHHRVKNNLQIISSLFSLQSKKVKDKNVISIFIESRNRILSMALVHENLYKNDKLNQINFAKYVKDLTDNLNKAFKVEGQYIKIVLDLEEIFISVETAMPLGLILNEIITNSFKHAFAANEVQNQVNEKLISIKMQRYPSIIIEVRDNGTGLPENFEIGKSDSLGMRLIKGLAEQISATLEINNDSGTRTIIKLTDSENKK